MYEVNNSSLMFVIVCVASLQIFSMKKKINVLVINEMRNYNAFLLILSIRKK